MKEKLVYVISNPAWVGWYKIGITSNWKARLSSYQTSSPYRDYHLVYGISTVNWKEVEKNMHNRFPSHREWVQADLEEIKDYLKSLTKED